jgi:hypothetical protein
LIALLDAERINCFWGVAGVPAERVAEESAGSLTAVGLHSIPGILLFDIICCTKIPEFSKACALKNRIGIDAAT